MAPFSYCRAYEKLADLPGHRKLRAFKTKPLEVTQLPFGVLYVEQISYFIGLMIHLILKPHRDNLQAATPDLQKLFVLLKVIPASNLNRVRPPLALAVAIDTSGSMRESARGSSKLERAMEATEAILNDPRLSENDLISIVQFDDVARVICPLSPIGNRQNAREALRKLDRYSGGTQIGQGLLAARHELSRIEQGGVATRVLLLTDGETFDPDDCRAAAAQLAQLNAPLVTIGVGDDYNEELLRDLAEIGRGRPYHLAEMERLGEIFQLEVGSSMREAVTDLKAQVQTVAGVALDSVTRVYPDLAEMNVTPDSDKISSVALGNIQTGDYTVFVLELTLSGRARNAGRARLAQVKLTGATPNSPNAIESPIHDIVVSFTGEQDAIEAVDDEVLGYVQQRNADRLVQNALRVAPNDKEAARQSLQSALELTRTIGNPENTRLLQNSLDELADRGKLSSATRKTIALETRTRTIKTQSADALQDVPDEAEIRRLTGA